MTDKLIANLKAYWPQLVAVAALIVGTGVAHYRLGVVEAAQQRSEIRAEEDHDTLTEIRTDVQWIKDELKRRP